MGRSKATKARQQKFNKRVDVFIKLIKLELFIKPMTRTVSLSPAIAPLVEEAAKREQRSLSNYVNVRLADYFGLNAKQPSKRKGAKSK